MAMKPGKVSGNLVTPFNGTKKKPPQPDPAAARLTPEYQKLIVAFSE
jgi:hypothetical protein